MADHLITVDRRFAAELQTTESTMLTDEELAEFNSIEGDEDKYRYLVDKELTVDETDINSEMQVYRIQFDVEPVHELDTRGLFVIGGES